MMWVPPPNGLNMSRRRERGVSAEARIDYEIAKASIHSTELRL
jgi:hypothetical protein